MIDDYARRLPPADRITALWADMIATNPEASDVRLQWNRFVSVDGLKVCALNCRKQLSSLLGPAVRDMARVHEPSLPINRLTQAGAGLGPALSRALSDDADGLCLMSHLTWAVVLLALPDTALVSDAFGSAHLTALLGSKGSKAEEGEGLCGLLVVDTADSFDLTPFPFE
jgi:hypothetical protein